MDAEKLKCWIFNELTVVKANNAHITAAQLTEPLQRLIARERLEARLDSLTLFHNDLMSVLRQEKIRISGRVSTEFAARDITYEEVKQFTNPTSVTLENVISLLDVYVEGVKCNLAALDAEKESTHEGERDGKE